jgi:glutaryl-CoA dehydrogenase
VEERIILDATGQYAHEKLQPRLIEAYREEATDPAIFRELRALGLLGVTLPEEFGGTGGDYVFYGFYGLVARGIGRGASGYPPRFQAQDRA